jgi:hypothetical protein
VSGKGGDLDAARRELTDKVMGKPGVSGTAVAERGGKPCLVVYVSDAKGEKAVPASVGGFRVVVERSGPFRRY